MQQKDERYEGVKKLIESGHIKEFKEIFTYVPKTILAADLGTNNNRMTRLIEHVEKFTLEEITKISAIMDVKYEDVLRIANNQYRKEKKPIRKK